MKSKGLKDRKYFAWRLTGKPEVNCCYQAISLIVTKSTLRHRERNGDVSPTIPLIP